MPPRCAACPANMYADHSLRLAQEIVTKNFFLRLLRQSEKMPLFAVGKGNVLHPLSVQDVLPDELVVGQDARFGQAEAVQPAAVAGVGGFARFLGAAYTMWAAFMLPALTPSTMPW